MSRSVHAHAHLKEHADEHTHAQEFALAFMRHRREGVTLFCARVSVRGRCTPWATSVTSSSLESTASRCRRVRASLRTDFELPEGLLATAVSLAQQNAREPQPTRRQRPSTCLRA
eukprot:3530609-Pleurochrysis_carterae.AAC.2